MPRKIQIMTLNELYKKGTAELEAAGISDCAFDALQLLINSTGFDRNEFYIKSAEIIGDDVKQRFFSDVYKRISGIPLQYIIGKWDFYKSEFYVGEGVLIPRPETEELTDNCINRIRSENYKVVYDLCAGTGCIGLSIAKELPDADVYLFELYDDALFYLKKNADKLSLKNVHIVKWDVLEGIPDNIAVPDMIVSNPPYISSYEISGLQKEVLFEPLSALDGGNDGLLFYRAIADKWIPSLHKGACVAVECGESQAEPILSIFGMCEKKEKVNDMYGVRRFVFAVK